jgi:hypothetical protein
MKRNVVQAMVGMLAAGGVALAQTTGTTGTGDDSTTSTASTTGFAPFNFGNLILTSTPSNATGNGGVSTVYTSSGSEFTFGTGGALVNPTQFNYVLTGPNTATITYPATNDQPASTTNLVFTSANSGTYTTVSGSDRTTGRFGLSAIPGAAPIENVSSRTTISNGGNTILGFVVGGTMPRRVLIRAVGPGLSTFGVSNPLQNPMLSLYRGTQLIATNDDWGTLLPITSSGSNGGTNSGGTTSTGTTSGTSSTGTSSTTTSTGTTGSTGAGVDTTGSGSSTSTNGFATGTLSNGATFTTQLATPADFVNAGAFSLVAGGRDAAFIATLPPGAYTVVVSSSTAATSGGATAVSGGSSTSASGTMTGASLSGTTTLSSGTTSGGSVSGTVSTGTSSSATTTSGTTRVGASTGVTAGSGTASTSSTPTLTTTPSISTPLGTSATGPTVATSAATSTTSGDVLIEVYFVE